MRIYERQIEFAVEQRRQGPVGHICIYRDGHVQMLRVKRFDLGKVQIRGGFGDAALACHVVHELHMADLDIHAFFLFMNYIYNIHKINAFYLFEHAGYLACTMMPPLETYNTLTISDNAHYLVPERIR